MIFSSNEIISVFSKRPQNMSLVYGHTSNSLKNREIFLKTHNIDYRSLVSANQVHGVNVFLAKEAHRGKGALSAKDAISDADALVTNVKNLPISIFTADCLSVFMYCSAKRCIGLVHAGWKGTRDNIVERTVNLMREEFDVEPGKLEIGFGPCMRSCCYEVGKEFEEYFPGSLLRRNGKLYLDLIEENRKRLLGLGVAGESIYDPCICTSCQNNEYFSYRLEAKSSGRMMSVIMLK